MPFGTEIGLGPGHIVLDGYLAPPKGHISLQFLAYVYCGQTAGWVKMPLVTEVDLGPDDIVLDGDPSLPQSKGAQQIPTFRPCLLWSNGRLSQLLLSFVN